MSEAVLWLVEVCYLHEVEAASQLRVAIEQIGGVMFDNDGQTAVAVTVAASSAAAARTKVVRQLSETGVTSVTVRRAVSRSSSATPPVHR